MKILHYTLPAFELLYLIAYFELHFSYHLHQLYYLHQYHLFQLQHLYYLILTEDLKIILQKKSLVEMWGIPFPLSENRRRFLP